MTSTTVIDEKTGRKFYLDDPDDLQPGQRVVFLLSLHGGGSTGAWQRRYFPAFEYKGRTFVPSQANNAYIFPGVGLGAIASGARRVTNEMFMSAARTLVDAVGDADFAQGSLFPPLDRIRGISASIAVAVAQVAYERGLASEPRPADIRAAVERLMYVPAY